MLLWASIGLLAPILLVFWRGREEGRGREVARYVAAWLAAWIALILWNESYTRERGAELIRRGAWPEVMLLDGRALGALIAGWIPSLLLVVALVWLRRMALLLRRKGCAGMRIALGIVVAAICAAILIDRPRQARAGIRLMEDIRSQITKISVYPMHGPTRSDGNEPWRASSAPFPVDVFVRAIGSATHISGDPPQPGFVTWVRTEAEGEGGWVGRIGEQFFAFESTDGYFEVTGAAGAEFSRQFRLARDEALMRLQRDNQGDASVSLE
jgi:hypothetical protein